MNEVRNEDALIEERDFFLRSLKDLEAEHAAGDIDDTDYKNLKDDYTSRAAKTIRQLEGKGADGAGAGAGEKSESGAGGGEKAGSGAGAGEKGKAEAEAGAVAEAETKPKSAAGTGKGAGAPAEDPATKSGEAPEPAASTADTSVGTKRRRKPWTRFQKLLVVLIVVFLGLTAGWMVRHRGNSKPAAPKHLSAAQVTSMLKQADAEATKDPTKAISLYQEIINVYPAQPQALTGEGWLYAQGGQLGAADADLQVAEKADPTWDLPHGYRGMVAFGEDKYADAVSELQYYLGHGPDPAITPQAQQALASAQKNLAATGTPGSPAPGAPGAPAPPGAKPGTPPAP